MIAVTKLLVILFLLPFTIYCSETVWSLRVVDIRKKSINELLYKTTVIEKNYYFTLPRTKYTCAFVKLKDDTAQVACRTNKKNMVIMTSTCLASKVNTSILSIVKGTRTYQITLLCVK